MSPSISNHSVAVRGSVDRHPMLEDLSELTTVVLTESGVRDLVERMLRPSGRRVDVTKPERIRK